MKPRFLVGVVAAAALAALSLAPVAAQRGQGAQPPDNAPTPRMADGHPDLNGWWGGGGGFGGGRSLADLTDEKGNVFLQLNARSQGSALGTASGQLATNFERDSGVGQRADPNKPIYKPELWDKVQYNDVNGNATDPSFSCGPQGVPRMGFPNKIVSNPTEVVFLYDNENTFRWIPINKPHNTDRDESYKGDSVAKWEGDTLVIDTNNFNDQTWLGWPGILPQRRDARDREGDAHRQHDQVRGDRGGSGRAAEAVGLEPAHDAPQHRSEGGVLGRSAVQRQGPRAHRHQGTRITGSSPHAPGVRPPRAAAVCRARGGH